MNYRARRAGSIVLGLLSAAGTVITAILVAKETPKALERINKLKQTKEKIKPIEYFKELAPVYWPAGVVCLGTIASTTISQVISMKTEASLIATSTVLSQGWRQYKGKVKEFLGIKNERLISDEISKEEFNKNINTLKLTPGEKLYWEEHIGFFSCEERNLLTALSDLNQRLHTPDPSPDGTFYFTTLYFLLKDAKAKVFDKEKYEACKNIGWTTDYLCEVYELSCMWVHPYYKNAIKKETGEVLFTKLGFWEDPIFLIESETSRERYVSREEYEHNAMIDMCDANEDMIDYDALALSTHGYQDIKGSSLEKEFINQKQDCDRVNDNGRRFQPSDLKTTTQNSYIEDDESLPCESDIPNSKDGFKA